MIVSNFLSQRMIYRFFSLSDVVCFLFKLRLQNPVPVSRSLTAPPCNESEVHRVFFWSQVGAVIHFYCCL